MLCLGCFWAGCFFPLVLSARTLDAQTPARIASPIDSARSITLQGTATRIPKNAEDQGIVRSDLRLERLLLLLSPSPDQQMALSQLLDSQQDRNSSRFHQWLTPEQFGGAYGAAPGDVQQVKAWLQAQGFEVTGVSKGARWIEFSGSVQQVQNAFHAELHDYLIHGESHIVNTRDLAIPEALSPVVAGIVSLSDMFKRPELIFGGEVARNSQGGWDYVDPATTSPSGSHFLSPADFATIYNVEPLYNSKIDGSGVTIAIPGRTDLGLSDIQAFRQAFNLPLTYPNVIVNGTDPGFSDYDVPEAALDMEWAGALAPGAAIDYVISASTETTDGIDLSSAYIVDNNLASVLSVSYSACEANLGTTENAFWNSLWQQAAAEGISVFVASGDSGAAGCDAPSDPNNQPATHGLGVNGLASTPWNTAVGGTEFNEGTNASTYWSATNGSNTQSVTGYIPEKVWNESCDPTVTGAQCPNNKYALWAGGGGVSSIYSKPSWQSATGVPADSMRDVPDVALSAAAHDGYLICYYGSCQFAGGNGFPTTLQDAAVVGGTSAATPAFAGIMALVDQKMGGRQGLANYFLYKIASAETLSSCNSSNLTDPTVSSTCSFYDTTAGNNNVPGQTGYSAGAGYDQATGLGSVNAANLISAWANVSFAASQTTLAIGTTTAQHGQPVTVSGSVTGSGQGTPTGSVTFLSDKYGPVGSAALNGSGSYSVQVSNLPGGQYNLTAVYSGDATFGRSSSAPVAMNVAPESSSITLAAYNYINGSAQALTTAAYGDYIYFLATVTGASSQGSATGTVSFYDAGVLIGKAQISGEGGALVVSAYSQPICLTVGQHSITASYSGDSSFAASATSQPLAISITRGNAATFFQETSLTVSSTQVALAPFVVSGSGTIGPTGTVQFFDNGTAIGGPVAVVQPTGSEAAWAYFQATLTAGSHTITASYSGDTNYLPRSSTNQMTVQVTNATGIPVHVTLTPASNSSVVGAYTQFTATVTSSQTGGPAITGTLQLYDQYAASDGLPVSVVNGSGTLTMQWSFAGSQTAMVEYSGDTNYASGGAASSTVVIARATPIVQLAVVPPNLQQQVGITATIADPATPGPGQALAGPTGRVQFYDSLNGGQSQPLGSPVNTMLGNQFTIVATQAFSLPGGTHSITALYLGDFDFLPTTSAAATVPVGTPSFGISGDPGSLTVQSGQSGTVDFSLSSGGGFVGNVFLNCSSGIPAGARCSFSPGTVPVGVNGGTAVLTLFTTAPSTVTASTQPHWLVPMAASFACVLLIVPAGRKHRLQLLPLICLVIVLSGLQACGGGGGGNFSSGGGGTTPPPALTTTTLTSSSAKVTAGGNVTVSASVSSNASGVTGSVTFYDGTTSLGTATLNGGTASLILNNLAVGTHSLTAKYSGDSGHSASTSGVFSQTITGTVQLTVLASSGTEQQTLTIPLAIE